MEKTKIFHQTTPEHLMIIHCTWTKKKGKKPHLKQVEHSSLINIKKKTTLRHD